MVRIVETARGAGLLAYTAQNVLRMLKEAYQERIEQIAREDRATEVLVGFQPNSTGRDLEQVQDEAAAGDGRSKVWKAVQSDLDDKVASVLSDVTPKPSEHGVAGFAAAESEHQRTRQHEIDTSWLTNTVRVMATPSMVKKLASHKHVAFLVPNERVRLPQPVETSSTNIRDLRTRERDAKCTWGIEALGLQKLWDQGLRGQGIVIGHLDTGVDDQHPDLRRKIDGFALIDPRGARVPQCHPFDSGHHGTHTAGTLVGGDFSGTAIGVAPEAKLASAAVLLNGRGTLWQIIKGMEWSAERGVRVVNMSLGGSGYQGAYEFTVSRLAALGIFVTCSIGNSGLAVTGSPGNLATACGVGAVDSKSGVSAFSGGGAICVYATGNKKVMIEKPDVVAPGEGIYSAIPESKWDYLNGTSMAAPHVAGVVALLWQAKPKASLGQILDALYGTARHPKRKENRFDSRYGRGLVAPLEALERLTSNEDAGIA